MGLRLASDAGRPPRAAKTDGGASFRAEVIEGLSAAQKFLPSKYFYDGEGSALFEDICALPEYYLTRTEIALLERLLPDLAASVEPGTALIEFGSGSSVKTRLLLDGVGAIATYVPVDIHKAWLFDCARALRADYPGLVVHPVAADFMAPLRLPDAMSGVPLLGFFPGSTIGNLEEEDAVQFLRRTRATLGNEGHLLIGIDLVKDAPTLIAAYDDAAGVTGAFNKNLLVRINRELGADFDPAAFAHRAVWNGQKCRVEMHLQSVGDQSVHVAGHLFRFAKGETIHTENSHKYTPEGFAKLAQRAGWHIARCWQSAAPAYAMLLLA